MSSGVLMFPKSSRMTGERQATLTRLCSHSAHQTKSLIPSPCSLIQTVPDLLKIHHKSISPDEQVCSLASSAETFCMLWLLSASVTFPSLRNWLSSHCQVCLILSCLTRCYLEPRLSGPLNPFVTQTTKKLGRRSLSGDWEEHRWTPDKFGWEEGAYARVQQRGAFDYFSPRRGW